MHISLHRLGVDVVAFELVLLNHILNVSDRLDGERLCRGVPVKQLAGARGGVSLDDAGVGDAIVKVRQLEVPSESDAKDGVRLSLNVHSGVHTDLKLRAKPTK